MQTFTKILILTLLTALTLSCSKNSSTSTGSQSQPATKHYVFKGKVVSIDKRANMANIDGEDIPGFMGAMVMPYTVKPSSELDKLSPGDAITADIVVQDDNSWIENVVVTGHSAPQAK